MFLVARGSGYLLALIALERNPALGPAADFAEGGLELATFCGEVVLDADRALGNDGAGYEVLGFERAKALGEHPVGDVRNGALDDGVAGSTLKQGLQDGTGPTATDQLNGPMKAGADLRIFVGGVGHRP